MLLVHNKLLIVAKYGLRFGWKATEEGILLQMYPNDTVSSLRRLDVRLDFRTFLRFLVNSNQRQQPMDGHCDQIVTPCGLCHVDYDWVGKIENLEKDGLVLLKQLKGASEQNLQFPSWQLHALEHHRRVDLSDE